MLYLSIIDTELLHFHIFDSQRLDYEVNKWMWTTYIYSMSAICLAFQWRKYQFQCLMGLIWETCSV